MHTIGKIKIEEVKKEAGKRRENFPKLIKETNGQSKFIEPQTKQI